LKADGVRLDIPPCRWIIVTKRVVNNTLIQQAVELIRRQLHEWLYQEMQQVLAEHASETTPVAEVDLNDDATMV
jgi:hypothetical protein